MQGRKGAGVWTVHGYTEDALASGLPSCLSDLAGWPTSLALSDLMSGGSLVACSEETGVERNWYPAGQPCCGPDAPALMLQPGLPEARVEEGPAVGTGHIRTLHNAL